MVELRNAFILAETEREGGVSPHVYVKSYRGLIISSPLAGISDVGNLLNGAGFKLTTIDQEVYRVRTFTIYNNQSR